MKVDIDKASTTPCAWSRISEPSIIVSHLFLFHIFFSNATTSLQEMSLHFDVFFPHISNVKKKFSHIGNLKWNSYKFSSYFLETFQETFLINFFSGTLSNTNEHKYLYLFLFVFSKRANCFGENLFLSFRRCALAE